MAFESCYLARLDKQNWRVSVTWSHCVSDRAASRFELRDLVLIGVGNESGVYTPETLQRITRLSDGLAREYRYAGDSPDAIALRY